MSKAHTQTIFHGNCPPFLETEIAEVRGNPKNFQKQLLLLNGHKKELTKYDNQVRDQYWGTTITLFMS